MVLFFASLAVGNCVAMIQADFGSRGATRAAGTSASTQAPTETTSALKGNETRPRASGTMFLSTYLLV